MTLDGHEYRVEPLMCRLPRWRIVTDVGRRSMTYQGSRTGVIMPYPNRLGPNTSNGVSVPSSAVALSSNMGLDARPEPSRPVLSLATPHLEATPGSPTEARLTVRNSGAIVDRFRLELIGPASEWATISPTEVSLFPEEVTAAIVTFHPPTDSRPPAGPHEFAVKATPIDDPNCSTVEEGTVDVAALRRFTAELLPLTSYGWRRGRHRLWFDNRGNVPLQVSVEGRDPNGLVRVRSRSVTGVTEAGAAGSVAVRVRAPRCFLTGAERTHRFTVIARAEGASDITIPAVLRQRPLLGRWVVFALAASLVLALLGYLLRPAIQSYANPSAASHPTGAGGKPAKPGPPGVAGLPGAPGHPGAVGARGARGPAGPGGAAGARGPAGLAGAGGPAGLAGAGGLAGLAGARGAAGHAGAAGATGTQGPSGLTGATGSQGQAGLTGAQGATGATGSQGQAGLTGVQGATGATGPTGPTGPTGAQGAAGSARDAGAVVSVGQGGPSWYAEGQRGWVSVTSPSAGLYCLTPDATSALDNTSLLLSGGSPGAGLGLIDWVGYCDEAPLVLEVATRNISGALSNDIPFEAVIP
jgi:collagen triple helix repeat protein